MEMDSLFTEFDDLEFWDDEEELELSMMEHLLYGTYYEEDEDREDVIEVPYEVDDWLELWRTYVGLDEGNDLIWQFNNKIEDWEHVSRILENLENLQTEDEEVFAKAFNSNFVTCFLLEVFKGGNNRFLNKTKIKSLAKWIQKYKVQEFSQKDFWRVIEHFYSSELDPVPRIAIDDFLVEFSRLWRVCTLKPIFISMKDELQKNTFKLYVDDRVSSNFYFGITERDLTNLLDFCDGVVDNERRKKMVLLEDLINKQNKEFLYSCLRKNFINKTMAKQGISMVLENNLFDFIPLLMLKIHGEWPEGMVAR